jgi:hypothetical protein
MKECRECDTVFVASQAGETGYAACRLCGGIDFIDVSEEDLQKVLKRLARKELCCPNPNCNPLLLTNEDRFCSKCGSVLEKSTLDLWIRKCVDPSLKKNPEHLFSDLTPFIEAARKMGFSYDRATVKLDEKIRKWSGQSYAVTAAWISQVRNMSGSLFSPADYAGILDSKNLYKNVRAGKTVVGLILKLLETPALTNAAEEIEINFTEHVQGQYIGFYNGANNKELWIYPVPYLKFSENTFSAVFPNLTAENYEIGNIDPRRASVIGSNNSRIWSLKPLILSQKQLIISLSAKAEERGIDKQFAQTVLKYFCLKYSSRIPFPGNLKA